MTERCRRCRGSRCVGMIADSRAVRYAFGRHVGEPMQIPLSEARRLLSDYARRNRGTGAGHAVREAALNLRATPCPQCVG